MRNRLIASAVAAALVWAAPGMTFEDAMAADSELQCDIRKTVEGNMVRLEALAVAGPAASGSYSFLIRKGGLSGITQNRQGGGFSVGPGETRVISTSMISVGPRDHFQAELTLEWNGGTRSCAVEG